MGGAHNLIIGHGWNALRPLETHEGRNERVESVMWLNRCEKGPIYNSHVYDIVQYGFL